MEGDPAMKSTAPAQSVLIIEDHADAAESLADFLRLGYGYRVATAPDGLTGLRMALADPPDAVVCDLGLPRRNGLLVAEELADTLPVKPLLIAVTGYADQVPAGLARDAGFDHLLAKPADPAAVGALIARHARPGPVPPGLSPGS
jgi:two-component system, sensor histidine kinase